MVLHFYILIETYGTTTIGMDVASFVGRLIFIENEEVACNVCSRK